jgi:hypothetical protein
VTAPDLTARPHPLAHLRLTELSTLRPLVGLWGGLAVLDLCRLLDAAAWAEVCAVAALVAACSVGVGRLVAVSVAAIGWLLLNGFVVHHFGQLGFVGATDLVRGALLLAVGLLAAGWRR